MIGSIRPSIQDALAGLKKAIDEGTLIAVKPTLLNATPEKLAQADEQFREVERAHEQSKANYRTTLGQITFNEDNSVSLPDVSSMSKKDAGVMLDGLRQMLFVGRLDGKSIDATNGTLSTSSIDVYKEWLQGRKGIDVYA